MSTFVSVGNLHQGFPRLLEAVSASAGALPQPVVVQHGHTPFDAKGCNATRFMSMNEFSGAMRAARVVIIQAGAGSILTAIEHGKLPVVVPRRKSLGEHVDDHQYELARQLQAAGRVILIEDVRQLLHGVHLALTTQPNRTTATMEPPIVKEVADALRRK